jgi:hypothetical protein
MMVVLVLVCVVLCAAGNPILDKAGQPLMVDADEGEEGEDDGKDEEEKKVMYLHCTSRYSVGLVSEVALRPLQTSRRRLKAICDARWSACCTSRLSLCIVYVTSYP